MSVPDLPGNLIPRNGDYANFLRDSVNRMCNLGHQRFPGAQPVSFGVRDLDKLEREDYWVCEKSDGVRVLLLVHTSRQQGQSVYLIDRHNDYRELDGFFFPSHEDSKIPMFNTLVDGELVLDTDPVTKKTTLRFLAFDCLVAAGQNVMDRPLDKRYGRLTEWFFKPYRKMLKDFPDLVHNHPFDIKVKEINFSYHAEKVFMVDIPALQHGNDGLIYTCVNSPYGAGRTDPNILKWKPPSENSIDFKLVLRFPPDKHSPQKPDLYAKPHFQLHVWMGGSGADANYELYDTMYVTDEEWEKIKESGEQYDDRIVEVHWDASLSHWRMMRFRDDKPNGNHRSVVDNIIQSIEDGVEKDIILTRSNSIRNAWKTRQAAAPPPSSHRPPPQPKRTPLAELRKYGPLATPPWSKVAGPLVVAGMKR